MTVLQIDREAAAKLLGGAAPDGLLEGSVDTLSLVQTLAAHREQATADLVEALRECLPILDSLGGGPAYQRARLALTKATTNE